VSSDDRPSPQAFRLAGRLTPLQQWTHQHPQRIQQGDGANQGNGVGEETREASGGKQTGIALGNEHPQRLQGGARDVVPDPVGMVEQKEACRAVGEGEQGGSQKRPHSLRHGGSIRPRGVGLARAKQSRQQSSGIETLFEVQPFDKIKDD
jgi:hypothetical protein